MEKIERISDTEVFIDGMKYIRDTFKSPQPKFQVGDWVVYESQYVTNIHRLKQIDSEGNGMDDSYAFRNLKGGLYRLATPQEIEQHLRKICEEKYIGKKVKSLFSDTIDTIQVYQSFSFSRDQMWYTGNKMGVLVYEQGKFADIVPENKKLPKTKEELMNFVLEDLHPFFYDSDLPKIMKIINDHEDT